MKALSVVVYWVGGAVGTIMALSFIFQAWGVAWGIPAIVLFPATFALVPWIAGFGYGEWMMLFVNYGSLALAMLLSALDSRQ